MCDQLRLQLSLDGSVCRPSFGLRQILRYTTIAVAVLLWAAVELPGIAGDTRWAATTPMGGSKYVSVARSHRQPSRPSPSKTDPTVPPLTPLTSLNLQLARPVNELPPNVAAKFFAKAEVVDHAGGSSRNWTASAFSWQPSALCHRPLYFQDVNLERHGLSFGIAQPAVSTAHAFGRFMALPYMMAVQCPSDPVFTLGHQRPGSPVPYQWHRLPLKLRAVTAEGMVAAGLILLVP